MAFAINITAEARCQLEGLSTAEQRLVADEITARLQDEPTRVTRALKKLRPKPLAGYELRLGDLRVLYKVDETKGEVLIVVVGRKVRNALIVNGEEFRAHQGDPAQ
jgi:mRNA-degrading endonuclease RelE of RelBE toxin-antitoxin system